MAQIGGVHPDKLLPWWHAARQLTPEEAEAVGRIATVQVPKYIAARSEDMKWWLEDLPQIPPRRADRLEWSQALSSEDGMRWYNHEGERKTIWSMQEALRQRDLPRLLHLLTQSRPVKYPRPELDLRPAWKKQLQEIRDALELRIDDALEQAVQAKAAEPAQG